MNSPNPFHSGWQAQPCSGDEYDAPRSRSQLDAIEESFEERDSSGIDGHKSQEESIKVTQFARPQSAHDDSPFGFSFTKAKPPQMDFSRKLIHQKSVSTTQGKMQETPVKMHQGVSPSCETGEIKVTSSHFPPSKGVERSISVDPQPPLGNHHDSVLPRESLVTGSKMPASHSVGRPEAVNPQVPPEPAHPSLEIPEQRPKVRQNRQPRTRITNPGGNLQKIPQQMIPQLPNSKSALSDEDLLNVLLLRQRAQQEKGDMLRAAEAAKDQEIGDLRDVTHNLYQQLQALQEQDEAKGTEISRLHAVIPQWENKIQNLKKHLDTLAKDHQDLMKGSKELQRQQEDAQAEKSALTVMLTDVHETAESDHRRYSATYKVLIEARHHIQALEQTIEEQEKQSREEGDLLHAERDRSQRLEAEMTKLTTSYHELTTAVTGHPDIILEKLSRILEISIQATAATQAQSQSELKSLLNQCVQILKKVHTMEMVKPQDFGKLDNSIRAYAQSLSRSMEQCGRTSESTKELQRSCASQVHEQLHDLKTVINVGRAEAHQVMDLREAKATIRERLQATETALAKTRQRALALESKEQLDIQRISSLELEVAKIQGRVSESPQLMIRFQELNIHNSELKDQVAASQQETLEISRQFKAKSDESSDLDQRVKNLEFQLDEARIETNKIADEKLAYEAKAVAETEQLRQQLSQAANCEEVRLESNYRNQIQQLRQMKTAAESESEERKRHLEMLQVEKDVIEGVASERLQALNELEAKKKQETEESDVFRTRIAALTLESEEKQKSLDEARERLKLAITDLEIKEKKILSLTATKALNVDQSTTSNFDTGDKPRRSINRSGRQVQFVVEDSQSIAFTEQSPASAKMTSKVTQSSYFNHTQSMAPPSSPIDDLLDLFPPTPVLQMQSREGSKTPVTRTKKGSHNIDEHLNLLMRHQKGSRGSQLSPSYQRDEGAKAQAMDQNHAATQFKPSSPQSRTKRATSEISQRHQPDPSSRQRSGVLRRPTTRAGRVDKRSALAAGHGAEQSGANKKSRVAGIKEGGLGPVMPDLRSPNGSIISAVRGRQVSKGSGRKTVEDKYIRRFSQEFL